MLCVAVSVSGWLVVSGASAGGTTKAAASAPAPAGIAGAVDGNGLPTTDSTGWKVVHVDSGRYELRFAGSMQVTLRSWNATGQVTVRPRSMTTWLVSFLDDGEPIDSGFSFVATPERPDVDP